MNAFSGHSTFDIATCNKQGLTIEALNLGLVAAAA